MGCGGSKAAATAAPAAEEPPPPVEEEPKAEGKSAAKDAPERPASAGWNAIRSEVKAVSAFRSARSTARQREDDVEEEEVKGKPHHQHVGKAHKPIDDPKVDQRVVSPKYGAGAITAIAPGAGGKTMTTVRFDSGEEHEVRVPPCGGLARADHPSHVCARVPLVRSSTQTRCTRCTRRARQWPQRTRR